MKTRLCLTILAAATVGGWLPLLSDAGSSEGQTRPTPAPQMSQPPAGSSPNCRQDLTRMTASIRSHQQRYGATGRRD